MINKYLLYVVSILQMTYLVGLKKKELKIFYLVTDSVVQQNVLDMFVSDICI